MSATWVPQNETRAQRRERVLEEGAYMGRQNALRIHTSLTCQRIDKAWHTTCVGGDRCICPCHDVAPPVPVGSPGKEGK